MAELINKKPLREIKGAGETFIAICNKILEDFLNGTYTNKFDRNSTTTGLERFILSSKGTREYEVLLRRVRGEKLKDIGREIAENDSEIVSRERIRQIEMIFLKSLEVPLLTLLKTRLISRGS